MIYKSNKQMLVGLVLLSLLSFGVFELSNLRPVQAADSDFSNGITVDSTGDGADANISDSICDDGSGNCTLRAAIEESNDEAGTQTIRFNITGTADFTNSGQNGYTIQPQSALPNITDTVIIDGYTQPGAQANTAIAPNPLNGILLIELDGVNAGNTAGLDLRANNSQVRGLAVGNFSQRAGIAIGANNLMLQGNYLGTDPTGTVAKPNYYGHSISISESTDALMGGLEPEDRNLISGNLDSAITPNDDSDNWTIQGNYIGVDASGLVALPNCSSTTSGALSLDYSNGHVVGGPEPTAVNIISGNNDKGIAPNGTDTTLIEGNYLGVGYDGVTPLPNGNAAISYGETNSNIVIRNNSIVNNTSGIYIDESEDIIIEGNSITNNLMGGVYISQSTDATIGGSDPSKRNIINNNDTTDASPNPISGNVHIGLGLTPTSNIQIQGNYIGVDENGQPDPDFTDQGAGIVIGGNVNDVLIGGENIGEGNIIANTNGPAVTIKSGLAPGLGNLVIPTENISVLGNSIHGSEPASIDGLGNSGLGIDLLEIVFDDSFVPESINSLGPAVNDVDDSDSGPNGYMNFPVINGADQNQLNLAVTYDLDAADSPTDQYRVEFFANDTADPSGYGEGQTFLGSTTVSPGSDKVANLTLPSGTNLTGKVLSATTTAVDGTTNSGFGSTSEFSQTQAITVSALPQGETDNNQAGGNLADTGQDIRLFGVVGIVIIVLAAYLARRTRSYTYIAGR